MRFSQEELDAMKNDRFFMVKHEVTVKVSELFNKLEKGLKDQVLNQRVFESMNLNSGSGKLFRGENYRLLPYIVLDYPRQFSKESVFAFRSMFWWGKGFSFTLHLQGTAWNHFRGKIRSRIEAIVEKDFYICVANSPWEYHYGKENYLELDEFTQQGRADELLKIPFLKLSRRLPVDDFEKVPAYGTETWTLLHHLLS